MSSAFFFFRFLHFFVHYNAFRFLHFFVHYNANTRQVKHLIVYFANNNTLTRIMHFANFAIHPRINYPCTTCTMHLLTSNDTTVCIHLQNFRYTYAKTMLSQLLKCVQSKFASQNLYLIDIQSNDCLDL